ncbi:hypothetical protein FSP39_021188 [Pinctada imbricata]|uniref:Sulfotransferase n=1 Tax=Pinctada imbricata TaxID=66713 RepID=A0AA89C727_PINIB|nr:hypothetical protein FSP39_021188 [Pinctada imbricata]
MTRENIADLKIKLKRTIYSHKVDKGQDQVKDHNQRLGFTPVLLLAYLRSGSSFTADIIQQAPNTFFVFEPLMNILQRVQIKTEPSCTNTDLFSEECRETSTNSFILDQMSGLFNCNFTEPFLQPEHPGGSINQMFLSKCLRIHKRRPNTCYRQLKQMCLKSSVRLVKTIRISVNLTKQLLIQIPNLKIVHLLRDPRAMIGSRKDGDFMSETNKYLITPEDICPRYERDLVAAMDIKRIWPDSIMQIYYEDLVLNPFVVSKAIYYFMGIKFPDKMQKWITEHTHSRHKNTYYYGTVRANSSSNIFKWKKSLQEKTIKETDKVCSSFYKSVNYFYKPYDKNS